MKTALNVLSVGLLLLFTAASAPRALGEDKPRYEIKIEQIKPQPTMSTRFRAAPEELGAKYGEAFGALYTYVTSNGGEITGPPFGRYHDMRDGKFDIEAGLPVAKVLAAKDAIKPSQLPGGTVATTMHVGPYEKLGEAHEALETWSREHGKKATGGPWESYLVEPSREQDPNKFETKLFLPIEAYDAAKPK
jgi:effector-binding domain-containing protein